MLHKDIDEDGEHREGQSPVLVQEWSTHRFLILPAMFLWYNFSQTF